MRFWGVVDPLISVDNPLDILFLSAMFCIVAIEESEYKYWWRLNVMDGGYRMIRSIWDVEKGMMVQVN